MKGRIAISLVLLGASPTLSQVLPATPPPVFAAQVDSVFIDAFVTNRGGVIGGLLARDFVLKDNGVPQPFDLVPTASLPIRAILVFDTSASMKGAKLTRLRSAASSFLDRLQSQDEAALVSFSSEVVWLTPLTPDLARVRNLLFSLAAVGATSAYDALFTSLVMPRSGLRTVVILFSDGEDNMSWLGEKQLRGVVERSNALIHVVVAPSEQFVSGFQPKIRRPDSAQTKVLRSFAEITGGSLTQVNSPEQIEIAFSEIIDGMKNRYVLRYAPDGEPALGWHALELQLATKKGKVRGRAGYWVERPSMVPPSP